LTQAGAGTTTLTAANTYTGGTTVNAGTLLVNGSNTAATTGAYTVNNGGTLAGTGTLANTAGVAVTVNSGGTIRGGNGTTTGTLTTRNVTVQSGGKIFANLAASGTGSRLSLGANTLDLKTGSILKLDDVSGYSATLGFTWIIAQLTSGTTLQLDGINSADGFVYGRYDITNGYTGPVQIDVSALPALGSGTGVVLSRSGNNLVLTFVPVPEPALLFSLAAGVLGVGSVVRKKFLAPATARPC
jgi:autotransporter-associated beta strand protein